MAAITMDQLGELIKQSANGRITREALQAFLENPNRFLEGSGFLVSVDYTLTLAAMIAAGKYDWVNSDITSEHFPIKGEGNAEIVLRLVHLDKAISTEAVLAELDQRGLRPATLPELLALGAKYPEIQRQFPIVALGSVWTRPDGGRDVPDLCGDGSRRELGLRWCGHDWCASCRFLAVGK